MPLLKSIVFVFLSLIMLPLQGQNTLVDGKKDGRWVVSYEDSKAVRYRGQFVMGKPLGEFMHFHRNGYPRSVMSYPEGVGPIDVKMFNERGQLIAEGQYTGPNIKDGLWVMHDGRGHVMAKEHYLAGQRTGLQQVFFPNGALLESGQMIDGEKQGTWLRQDEIGNKVRATNHAKGMLNGPWTQFDADERLAISGQYLNGRRVGKWLFFDQGKAVKSEQYRSGRLKSTKSYSNG